MTMRHLPAYTRILGLMTAALLLLPAAATAQPQKRFLTLEQCRSIALDSSAILRSARLTEEKTALDRKAVITNFLPKFSAYGLYLWTSSSFDYDFSGGALPPPVHLTTISAEEPCRYTRISTATSSPT